jgi:hypothetical protein
MKTINNTALFSIIMFNFFLNRSTYANFIYSLPITPQTVGYAKQMNAQSGGPPSSSVSPKIKSNVV